MREVDISEAMRSAASLSRDSLEMSKVKTFIKDLKVVIARGIHLFPFRTEKLSLVTPMVLRNSGRVGSRRFSAERESVQKIDSLFFVGLMYLCYHFAMSISS